MRYLGTRPGDKKVVYFEADSPDKEISIQVSALVKILEDMGFEFELPPSD